MKLKKFITEKDKRKRKIIIFSIVACVLVIGIVIYRSYALYEEKTSYNVLKGTIPPFGSNMELTFTIDGQSSNEAFPSKDSGYISESVTCDDGVTAGWNNESWSLTNINSNNNNKIKCNVNFVKNVLAKKAKIGDYVKMTPTSTSYTISASDTSYTSDQIINPSELNMWRIIKINEDGTIEMVSENVSTTKVYFHYRASFPTYIKILNEIASSYETKGITIGSRHIGYNGQSETISFVDNNNINTYVPWNSEVSSPTTKSESCNSLNGSDREQKGGGDCGYLEDYILLSEILGTRIAKTVSGVSSPYWLASRWYGYYYTKYAYYAGRKIDESGVLFNERSKFVSTGNPKYSSCSIRPVLKIDSLKLSPTGSGTLSDPWNLN